ncbi:MAG TPA: BON domain-containing protein [Verrucomicrobiae bacterium]|nr:BON domain-containing protein [Verrucomicrobiae bacterium]
MKMKHMIAWAAAMAISLQASAAFATSETDERIESAARRTYVYRTYLKDDAINIRSEDGIVTLTGTVSDPSHKGLAEDTVEGLPGVKRVVDQLEVQSPPPSARSDDWISAKVKAALMFHRSVSGRTQVYVKDGVATLKGTAASQAQKDLTTEYARDVDGVKGVVNDMTVATNAVPEATLSDRIDDASVTAQVKMTLLFHRSTSALHTGVETTGGVVTLTGTAKNQAEKDLVTKLVMDIKGVKDVHNNMTIGG